MKDKITHGLGIVALALFSLTVSAQQITDPLLDIASAELNREWEEYRKLSQPPYFISYRIHDLHSASLMSSFGSLVESNDDTRRILVPDVKVGDYSFDSSHPVESGDEMDFSRGLFRNQFHAELPVENRKEPLQLAMWQATQQTYRVSLESYNLLKNDTDARSKSKVDDFSKETPTVHLEPMLPSFKEFFDKKLWEEKVRKYSAPFLGNKNIVRANASLDIGTERKYFLSTDGAKVAQNRSYAFLAIAAAVRAEDGDILPLHVSYFAFTASELPSEEKILKDIQEMMKKLELLRKAPLAEPYTGPAILHARAAGVFFHEIFGHRVEGHRLKNHNDGQTFKGKLNEQLLPKSLSVVFDPGLAAFKGQPLNGHYFFDDEGVKGQRVKVVEDGVLKTFLMSRSPIEGISKSNGHGRCQAGLPAVTRQSNLIIENKKEVSMNDLRKMLISECKKQKKPYGYFFSDVIGGFTTTDRSMPNAFNIFPTEVYRVYVDGRPDELVRGVDLIGTPLAMFAGITAAAGDSEVFTGFCGAESGSVPVTAVSPSLFVKRIETQKKYSMESDETLIERPQQSMNTPVK
jgi:TldD protein